MLSAAKFSSVLIRLQKTLENLIFVLKREGCESTGQVTERHVGMLEHIVGMLPTKQVAFTVVGVQPTYLLLRQIAFQAVVIAVPFVVLRLAGVES